MYMQGSQVAKLSHPLSEQRTGIILHWQGYRPGEGLKDYQHNYYFVPKTHPSGKGVSMLISADECIVAKYVYVRDGEVAGYESNASSAHLMNGLTLDNRMQVLTGIIGV